MDGIHLLNLIPNCQNNFMFYSKDHKLSVSVISLYSFFEGAIQKLNFLPLPVTPENFQRSSKSWCSHQNRPKIILV